MGDRSFADGSSDADDHQFDQLLRDRLASGAYGLSTRDEDAAAVLDTLEPRMVRARLARRAQMATLAVPVLLALVGLIVVPQVTRTEEQKLTVAGEPDVQTTVPSAEEERSTVSVTGTTVPARSDEAESDDGESATSVASEQQDGDGSDEGSDAAETSVAPQDPSVSTTAPSGEPESTGPSSTAETSTTPSTAAGGSTTIPGSTIVESDCGSIVVRVVNSAVELLEVREKPGYGVDIKSEGPEVEVSLEGRFGHCELTAKMEDGTLETSNGADSDESGD